MNKNMITEEGYQSIKKKLSEHWKESREIAKRLSYASLDGDLSENADWTALKENLEKVYDKINKLSQLLENSEVVRDSDLKNNDLVWVGSKVSYQLMGEKETSSEHEKTLEVELTSEVESDPFIGKVSYQSPLGSSLLNRRVGEVVNVSSSTSSYQVKIISIN